MHVAREMMNFTWFIETHSEVTQYWLHETRSKTRLLLRVIELFVCVSVQFVDLLSKQYRINYQAANSTEARETGERI